MNHHSTYKSSFCAPTSLTVIRSLKLKSFHKGRICGQINILRDLTKQRGTNATTRLYKANVYPYIVKTEKDKTKVGGYGGTWMLFTLGLKYLSTSQLPGLFVIWKTTTSWKSLELRGILVPGRLWKWMLCSLCV